VAGCEDEREQLVLDLVTEPRLHVRHLQPAVDLQLPAELVALALVERLAAEAVDRAVLGGGHEPGARVVRDA
jgi:hypothetical protein